MAAASSTGRTTRRAENHEIPTSAANKAPPAISITRCTSSSVFCSFSKLENKYSSYEPANGTLSGAPTTMPGVGAEPFSNGRSEEHTSELQSRFDLVCRLLLEK